MSKYAVRITAVVLVAVVLLQMIPVSGVMARTLDEIQAEINSQKKQLSSVKSDLSAAESKLANMNSNLKNAQGEIPRLEAEIKKLKTEIEINQLQLSILEEDKDLKDLELEQREVKQDHAINNAYRTWKAVNQFQAMLADGGSRSIKSKMYQSQVLAYEQGEILDLSQQVDDITAEISDFESETKSLKEQNRKLKEQKAALEQQLAWLNGSINQTSGHVAGLRAQMGVIQSNIKQLSAEQKALQEYEAWILGQGASGGTKQLQTGQYYFTGVGRDMYQGHGIGMSQFGAFGAAKAGWNANQILRYYYTNVHIEARASTVTVNGYGTMNANKYVSGLGEVPSKACGTPEQVANDTVNKYVIDNPNTIWDCWPEEAIKAQVIAARSYAVHNGSVCTTASCQVYIGGNAKKWAADETKDMVIVSDGNTHRGRVILALYSSDNNQGGYGTADNDTVFSDFNGNGTPYSYLRHVEVVPATSYQYLYTNYNWRTNGYTNAQFTDMVRFGSRNASVASANSFMAGVLNDIGGQVTSVYVDQADRDGSRKVRKITIAGPNGSRKIAGWLFKSIWNSWVYAKKPSGQLDYIYSLTFFPLRK